MGNIVEKFHATAGALHRQIEDVRQQISASHDEIHWLESVPPPVAEIKERICSDIDQQAANFFATQQKGALAHEGSVGEFLTTFATTEPFISDAAPTIAHMPINASPVLCWLLGDALKARFAAAFDNGEISFEEGPPTLERPALIEAARERLQALETEEEALITTAEAVGLEVERRPDADPSVILEAYVAHIYKFRAAPTTGNYHFGEIESDEPLTRGEITTRARHAIPREWLDKYELESVEILEPLDSDDIIDDGDDDQQPRATTRRTSRRKAFISKGFGPDPEKAAIENDLRVADDPPRMK